MNRQLVNARKTYQMRLWLYQNSNKFYQSQFDVLTVLLKLVAVMFTVVKGAFEDFHVYLLNVNSFYQTSIRIYSIVFFSANAENVSEKHAFFYVSLIEL